MIYQFIQDEQGSAAIEYSLFIGLIGVMIMVAVQVVGNNLADAFSSINSAFPTVLVREDSRNAGVGL